MNTNMTILLYGNISISTLTIIRIIVVFCYNLHFNMFFTFLCINIHMTIGVPVLVKLKQLIVEDVVDLVIHVL